MILFFYNFELLTAQIINNLIMQHADAKCDNCHATMTEVDIYLGSYCYRCLGRCTCGRIGSGRYFHSPEQNFRCDDCYVNQPTEGIDWRRPPTQICKVEHTIVLPLDADTYRISHPDALFDYNITKKSITVHNCKWYACIDTLLQSISYNNSNF